MKYTDVVAALRANANYRVRRAHWPIDQYVSTDHGKFPFPSANTCFLHTSEWSAYYSPTSDDLASTDWCYVAASANEESPYPAWVDVPK